MPGDQMEFEPGTLLYRNDGYTARVTEFRQEEAVLLVQRPAVDGVLPPEQEWRGDPAVLVNCWNLA